MAVWDVGLDKFCIWIVASLVVWVGGLGIISPGSCNYKVSDLGPSFPCGSLFNWSLGLFKGHPQDPPHLGLHRDLVSLVKSGWPTFQLEHQGKQRTSMPPMVEAEQMNNSLNTSKVN